MAPPKVYDGSNQEIKLGRQLGAGGEGAVYEVVGRSSDVAKLYHHAPSSERAEKLRYMASRVSGELTKVSAWPITTLHDRVGGPVRGFVMPRVAGKEIHVLYGVSHRRKEFPKADWRFLLHTATNCAAVFDTVHRAGYVIADVNQKNVVASDTATVGLLDCDSFQMTINGKLFGCEVGVAEYTPPELQGKGFRGVIRTQNHDLFGLAIHIFHLLFMGRHPFMGRLLVATRRWRTRFVRCASCMVELPHRSRCDPHHIRCHYRLSRPRSERCLKEHFVNAECPVVDRPPLSGIAVCGA
jgi:DNA-binding helix-hairpin-helix protein with protein kinase domain